MKSVTGQVRAAGERRSRLLRLPLGLGGRPLAGFGGGPANRIAGRVHRLTSHTFRDDQALRPVQHLCAILNRVIAGRSSPPARRRTSAAITVPSRARIGAVGRAVIRHGLNTKAAHYPSGGARGLVRVAVFHVAVVVVVR